VRASTPPPADTLGQDGPAEPAPLAVKSLLLSLAPAGDQRLVACGERGHILLSDDQGATWRQVPVPTRATLNAVHFADARHGFAVGHLGTILRTADGGETWQKLPSGRERAAVLLDVLALSPNDAIAVGAYGLYLRTRDAGATWTREEPQTEQYHFNRIARTSDGALFLVGEAGTILRSLDGGASWEPVPARPMRVPSSDSSNWPTASFSSTACAAAPSAPPTAAPAGSPSPRPCPRS
jgi:photosystem II stability/assembly factor-like uncharacterized protein